MISGLCVHSPKSFEQLTPVAILTLQLVTLMTMSANMAETVMGNMDFSKASGTSYSQSTELYTGL